MSAKEHDHDHDHGHDHHDHAPTRSRRLRCRRRPSTATGSRCASSRARRDWQLDAAAARSSRPARDRGRRLDPMSRRNFFHLMGASMGLAGLAAGAGCRRYEKEEIVPLARRPEDQVPGQTLQYATTFELGGVGARARRDLVRGSPDPPRRQPRSSVRAAAASSPARSATPARRTFAQAAILHLYDPDRSQSPLDKRQGLVDRGVPGRARRSARSRSPRAALACSARRRRRRRSPRSARRLESAGVGWHEYEPISWDNERVGTQARVRSRGASARAPRPRRDDRHDRLRSVRRASGRGCATAATSRAAAARTARSASAR